MKKLIALLTVCSLTLSAMAQMAIPGGVFASNPTRFDGRKVTIKNIEIIKTDENGMNTIGGPGIAAYRLPAAGGALPPFPLLLLVDLLEVLKQLK